jgi:hypothetical protein
VHAMILPWMQRQQASVAPATPQEVASAWLAADPTTQQKVMTDLGMSGTPPAGLIAMAAPPAPVL